MRFTDAQLDDALRAVPLPEGLTERLRALALADDEDVDGLVCEVPEPEGLLKRLALVALEDDEGLDQALRNVPVPLRLTTGWRRRTQRRPVQGIDRVSRFAVVASLLMAVGLTAIGAMLLSFAINRSQRDLAQTEKALPKPVDKEIEPAPVELAESWGSVDKNDANITRPEPPRIDLANLDGNRPATVAPPSGPMPADVNPLLPAPRPDVLTAETLDQLLELPKRIVAIVPRGIEWPLVPGSNSPFLIRHGVHPFVSPAANPRLQSCLVPLGIDATGYELARRYVQEGELPPADLVRTEDFLAAVDYGFPRPENQAVGLTLAAGPSPFRGEGYHLVQVGVQARQETGVKHAPVHLVLVVDTSGSMRWGGRVDLVRRTLKSLAQRLAPEDRLSLVSFNENAHLLIQNVGPQDLSQFMAATASLSAGGLTNVSAGLGQAYAAAQEEVAPGRPAVRVVLFTDGWLELDPKQSLDVERRATQMAERGMPLSVIDLGQENRQSNLQLATLAEAGRGTVHRAANADQIRWGLEEIMTGRSQLVARGAQLKVTFNPKAVMEYRLLGHEANSFAGMMPGQPDADLRQGQAATAVFEVRLAPNAANDVATAEITWYKPESAAGQQANASEKAVKAIELTQFAATFAKSAPSLQVAAVVAEAAEVLRRSPFVRLPKMANALYHVSEVVAEADSVIYQRPSFAEFAAFVQEAIRAKPARGNRRP